MRKVRKRSVKFAGGRRRVARRSGVAGPGARSGARGAEVTDQLGGGHIDSPACLIGAARPARTLPTPATLHAAPWINRREQLL